MIENMPMLSCRDLAERLSAYADGELDADMVRAIEMHLGACHPCTNFFRGFDSVVQAAKLRRPVQVPEGMADRIIDQFLAIAGSDKVKNG